MTYAPLTWDGLDDHKFTPEAEAVAELLAAQPLAEAVRRDVVTQAAALVAATRRSARKQGVVEGFLKEFSLGTREGLALMCLAEALLRTPDAATRDQLIAEQIGVANWEAHLGKSDSLFVNASTWGLMLTGKLVDVGVSARQNTVGYFRRLTTKMGEPVIRQALLAAVRIMGEQFVLGRTIEAALARAQKLNMLCSFDMLGEGARTAEDGARYFKIYADAIESVGLAAQGAGPENGHGVSVKLSALCPRYEATQEARVWEELYPRLRALALIAAHHDINLAIDAEEADRLTLSLKLVERLAREEALGGWTGLGVVVQAYQKRAPRVIECLADLAGSSGRRIMVRLVKGAYWDSEIKRAQVAGFPDYPVYTTKAATDLSYLVCARALIAASPSLYPQFATHNAHTLMAVRQLATAAGVPIEFQRLHGMGEALYAAAATQCGDMRVRAYAPVGGHEDLLPYLVRRLLENGANSSFVHVLLDESVPAHEVVRDPVAQVESMPDRHPRIPLPRDLYGKGRVNPEGRDLSQARTRIRAAGMLAEVKERLSVVTHATLGDVEAAVLAARGAQSDWNALGGAGRAKILRAMADALADQTDQLVALLQLEAFKTYDDAVAEVREAVDFCRYYAQLAIAQFGPPTVLKGPVGEINDWQLGGRGVFVCISPWNFPLAIFVGQIAAALAAGNAVVAKPAEQTPCIAAEAVRLFHAVGLPHSVLVLVLGDGVTIGGALVAHDAIAGVAFTGGTETAWAINRSLAARNGAIVPFIAETGGLNAMFVDTTALTEQVIDDVMQSAFGAAGQRCSALRLLFVPHASADAIIEGLKGALATRRIGDPTNPAIDIGPVIDATALSALRRHRALLEATAQIVGEGAIDPSAQGHYFAPIIAEVPTPDFLEREVFGPILHVYRYAPGEIPKIAAKIAARGYGLTLGIHSRIDRFARDVQALVPAGNIYINRSMIGAVVGVQPFGGVGLSGTGPKAGGPHALHRFAQERAVSNNIMAKGGDLSLFTL